MIILIIYMIYLLFNYGHIDNCHVEKLVFDI